MPDAALNDPVIVYGLSIESIVTMFCTAHTHMTKNTTTKNTRLIIVRLLMTSTSRAIRVAHREPRVDLREPLRDPQGHAVEELVHPVEQRRDLCPTLSDLAENRVDLLDLEVDLLDVGVEHLVVLCLDEARQRLQR